MAIIWRRVSPAGEESLTSWEPSSHENLHQRFGAEIFVVTFKNNVADFEEFGNFFVFFVHDSVEDLVDWVEDVLNESTFGGSLGSALHPLFTFGIIKVITPETFHEFWDFDTEFLGVH